MKTIQLVDLRSGGLDQLARTYPDSAREIIVAARKTLGSISYALTHLALPIVDKIALNWLKKTHNPYLDEIDACAKTLGIPGVYAVNVCFELGCTTSVYSSPEPMLVRVLDWVFSKLGEHIVVARQSGAAGDFYNVTWPGLSGIFQGVAPHRFAAAINQAPMRRHNLTIVGDWLKGRTRTFSSNGLPPAHLLRIVFERARNYREALTMLSSTQIALPAIYVLSGINADEGCVIERTENACVIRPLQNGRVCATNHFEGEHADSPHGWRARPMNSHGRLNYAQSLKASDFDENFAWLKPPIAMTCSRLALRASAATDSLDLIGLANLNIATHPLRIRGDERQVLQVII